MKNTRRYHAASFNQAVEEMLKAACKSDGAGRYVSCCCSRHKYHLISRSTITFSRRSSLELEIQYFISNSSRFPLSSILCLKFEALGYNLKCLM